MLVLLEGNATFFLLQSVQDLPCIRCCHVCRFNAPLWLKQPYAIWFPLDVPLNPCIEIQKVFTCPETQKQTLRRNVRPPQGFPKRRGWEISKESAPTWQLVNVCKKRWKDPPSIGKSTISMAIFNSYVKLFFVELDICHMFVVSNHLLETLGLVLELFTLSAICG